MELLLKWITQDKRKEQQMKMSERQSGKEAGRTERGSREKESCSS